MVHPKQILINRIIDIDQVLESFLDDRLLRGDHYISTTASMDTCERVARRYRANGWKVTLSQACGGVILQFAPKTAGDGIGSPDYDREG